MVLTCSVRTISSRSCSRNIYLDRWNTKPRFNNKKKKKQECLKDMTKQKCSTFTVDFTPGGFAFREIRNSSWVKVNTSPVRMIHAPMTHPITLFSGFICPFVVAQHSLKVSSLFLSSCLSPPELIRGRAGRDQSSTEASNMPWWAGLLAVIPGQRDKVSEAGERLRPQTTARFCRAAGDGAEICAALDKHRALHSGEPDN